MYIKKPSSILWWKQGVFFLLITTGLLLIGSCASSRYQSGFFVKKQDNRRIEYQVGELSMYWKRMKNQEGDLVFRHREKDATISANVQCNQDPDRSIEFVIDDLFSDISESSNVKIQEIERRQIELLHGIQALELFVHVPWGKRVLFSKLIVIRDQDCIYDLQLISSAGDFPFLQNDFQTFYRGFVIAAKKKS